ncbi:hypothetical protein IEO21_03779 [Rhodonia placenta]|uniref:SH3 domain-containing protein n=1 Tax=Rhodonia placenta TaxID=104341 RepID=A0A8H7U3K9_9APHY|nr:hypothetical protein IEO21_03779 [Postia placenta]
MTASPNFGRDQGAQQSGEEQYISTFFCRALYDYQTSDASSLSFHKDDVIEVLTQLESGWWDGLLGDERGWFPSNYVAIISDQEAEVAINGSEYVTSQPPSLQDDSMVDMAQSMSSTLSNRDGDWLDSDVEYSRNARQPDSYVNGVNGKSVQHNDFWVPQVSQDGRHSRDLPQEMEEDPDGDFAGLASSQISPRGGSSAGLGLANGLGQELGTAAGFGISKRSRVPDPWEERLADDGLSYYYVNKLDGQISWTRPEATVPMSREASSMQPSSSYSSRNGSLNGRGGAPAMMSRMRSDSSVSGPRERSDSNADRYSINSDDSEVFPQRARSGSSANARPTNGAVPRARTPRHVELTPPEQLAKALQHALTPPGPASPVDLSNHVREAIADIMDHLRSALSPRRPDQFEEIDKRVQEVVSTVRNLLYVTATPIGHIPSNLYFRDGRDSRTSTGQSMQSHLKAAQRKVSGTLSKLVLSALAMQYDPALTSSDRPNRIESDVAELERAVVTFVTEVHAFQEQNAPAQGGQPSPITKRLYGVLSPSNVGLGLPGAGAGGSWRGFGYVPLEETEQSNLQAFTGNQVQEVKIAARGLGDRLGALTALLKRADFDTERLRRECQSVIAHLSSILEFVGNIDVARHVDVDGVRLELGQSIIHIQYMETVEKARLLVRTMEAALQSLYDDGTTLLLAAQDLGRTDLDDTGRITQRDYMDALVAGIIANANVAVQSLEALLGVGFDQSDISQTDYANSIEWRKSRPVEMHGEEVVDLEMALGRPGTRVTSPMDAHPSQSTLFYESSQSSQASLDMMARSRSGSVADSAATPTWPATEPSESGTLVSHPTPDPEPPELADMDEDEPTSAKSPPRSAAAARKIMKILGDDAPQHILQKLNADSKPWYLRPNYDQLEILMDPDGAVRAGTPSALVERLTAHEHGDPTFNQNFLLTFKSFMTLDDFFDLLVRRFWVQPPANLSPAELEEWTKLKQHVIRMRCVSSDTDTGPPG